MLFGMEGRFDFTVNHVGYIQLFLLPHPTVGMSYHFLQNCGFKPCTNVASNLPKIGLRLDVQIACDGLQQKFHYAEYFTCDPLIFQSFSSDFHPVFTVIP